MTLWYLYEVIPDLSLYEPSQLHPNIGLPGGKKHLLFNKNATVMDKKPQTATEVDKQKPFFVGRAIFCCKLINFNANNFLNSGESLKMT